MGHCWEGNQKSTAVNNSDPLKTEGGPVEITNSLVRAFLGLQVFLLVPMFTA